MSDDVTDAVTVAEQPPNEIAEHLLDADDGEEIALRVDGGMELVVSVTRSLHLRRSVRDGVDGGSLRYAVEANDGVAERLDLPSPAGLIAAQEVETGSWNRSRIGFYELVTRTDDDGDEFRDYGEQVRSYEITAVDGDHDRS